MEQEKRISWALPLLLPSFNRFVKSVLLTLLRSTEYSAGFRDRNTNLCHFLPVHHSQSYSISLLSHLQNSRKDVKV